MRVNYQVSEEMITVQDLARDHVAVEEIENICGTELDKEMILFVINQVNQNRKLGEIEIPLKQYKVMDSMVEKGLKSEEIVSKFQSLNHPAQVVKEVIEKMKKVHYPHPEKNKYQPDKIIAAADGKNQLRMGNANGCTHFSCSFLSKNDNEINDNKIFDIISQKDLGIQMGINGEPVEVIGNFPNLRLVDLQGQSTNDETLCYGDVPRELETQLNIICNPNNNIQGCLITTGIETFALRVAENEIQLFDPHGDSTQNEPSCVWIFNSSDEEKRELSTKKIVEFIIDRSELIIQETGQLTLCPVKII